MKKNDNYNEESALATYFKDINDNTRLLTDEEEYILAVKAKEGDLSARNKLIESNLRFVVKIAKQFQGRGIPLEDLIQEGSVGLTVAIDKFEPQKGYKFISYGVWWVRQTIQKAIAEKSRMIRLPMNRSAELARINQVKQSLEKEGLEVTDETIAQLCELDRETVRDLIQISSEISSLDAPIANESGSANFGEFLESNLPSPEEIIVDNSLKEDVHNALKSLDEREREIIMLRFGLSGRKPMSLKEIGDMFDLTKERIRQIEKKAIEKMHDDKNNKHLKAYIA